MALCLFLHLQTLPYQNRIVAIFSPCIYGCLYEFKLFDLYRDRKINLFQSSWKACHLVRVIIRILKMDSLPLIMSDSKRYLCNLTIWDQTHKFGGFSVLHFSDPKYSHRVSVFRGSGGKFISENIFIYIRLFGEAINLCI